MSWWHYLLLVNFYLLLFFAFYALLLRRETFFQLNRIYLVAASLLSFAIPVIQADWVKNLFITKQVQYTLYGTGAEFMVYNFKPAANAVTIGNVLTLVYIAVTLILTIRLLWQLIVLKKQIEKPSPSAAYSFFKKISLGKDVAQHHAIAHHEQVHARQWHSVDVMIIETVMIINWFNPVVYLYRFAIKYIHEYIADMQVIQSGTDKADYAMLLLSQTFHVPAHKLTNPFFSNSMLKKRILMLQKSRSHRIMLIKYCLSAPLFVLMMVLSSATVNNSTAINTLHKGVKQVMLAPVDDITNVITEHAEITAKELKVAFPAAVKKAPSSSPYTNQLSVGEEAEDLLGDKKIFISVEQAPSFPGGLSAFGKFLEHNIRYPAKSRENNIQGKVFVSLIVETDGSLSDIVAVRGPSDDIKAEAVRVLASSPKWEPGIQNGKQVRVQYMVPINFVLGDDDDDLPPGANDLYNSKPLGSVERYPVFPGGYSAFTNFLSKNLRYPAEMRTRGLQGKVFVTFIVNTDGQLSDIRAVRGPSEEFNDEAVRVLSSSPKWIPGVQNGRVVKVQYTVPINFTLSFDDGQSNQPNNYMLDEVPVTPVNSAKPSSKITGAALNAKPLVVVDGVINEGGLNNLKPEKISSINIFKGNNVPAAYAERGKDGVIVVTSKK